MDKRIVNCGGILIGDGHISVQSMTNTSTLDVDATVKQIVDLKKAGCDIVRVAVPDIKSAKALKDIIAQVDIPVVADVHFVIDIAIQAVLSGAHKIRINPGNMKGDFSYLVSLLKERNIPVRVGVNAGSIAKEFKKMPLVDGLVLSALSSAHDLEKQGLSDIVLSVKSSDVVTTIKAYEKLSCEGYPLHIGVTEAGTLKSGLIKNSIGIGALLYKGIGDTIRVSLSTSPIEEVYAARKILSSLGINKNFIDVIACPTCGRTKIDVSGFAQRIEQEFSYISKPLKIAIMGCVVNGIGESEGADIGIAGGEDKSAIFCDGKIVETISNDLAYETLKKYILKKANDEQIF